MSVSDINSGAGYINEDIWEKGVLLWYGGSKDSYDTWVTDKIAPSLAKNYGDSNTKRR